MTHTNTEQGRVDTTVFKRLLNDYADCLRNGDFQDAGAAFLAVVAEYQQAARRAPAESVISETRELLYKHAEQERAEFEARFKHLDLTQEPVSWGVPRYKHDAISLAWDAWQAARRAPQTVPQWDGKINPADFNVETFRRSRNGWLVKPDNCVRITHVPTGLFEEGVSERSIHANKAVAWQRLSDRLESLAVAPKPPEAAPTQEGWCDGCNPDNCVGCGPAAPTQVQPNSISENRHD